MEHNNTSHEITTVYGTFNQPLLLNSSTDRMKCEFRDEQKPLTIDVTAIS